MKKAFFVILAFIFCSSLAWAVPDRKGYNKFLKENNAKIREMERACNEAKGTKLAHKKCNDLMEYRVEAECRYGINPNACAAIDAIKKTENKK
jgi:hypothetical protein